MWAHGPRPLPQLLAVCALLVLVPEVTSQPSAAAESEFAAGPDGTGDFENALKEPPPWMDETFMQDESAAKAAVAQLTDEANLAHQNAKKAAVAAARAKMKADEAARKMKEDLDKKVAAFKGGSQPLDAPAATAGATPDGSSCNPNNGDDCGGGARRMAIDAPVPTVTLLTLNSDTDLLPLELMLPHHVAWSSKEGREGLERVLVFKMPPSPHHTAMHPGALPFSNVPLRSAGERDGADQVIQLDLETLKDQSFFKKFLADDGQDPAKSLHDLWSQGHQTSMTRVDESVFLHSTTSLGLLTAIDRCNSTYCAFLEPDVFVHRHPNQKGWIDRAVDLLEADPQLVVVQAARMSNSETPGSCSTAQSRDGLFSQRYFVLHRKRLQKYLPIHVDCAPRCDTFEAFFALPKESVGIMSCNPTASWVIHPPEDEHALLRLFEDCARAVGREQELAGDKNGNRRLEDVALPCLPKEHEKDDHVLNLHRRLAASSWVGLPEFLDHITSAHDFSPAGTISVGEQMTENLRGWSCPASQNERAAEHGIQTLSDE